MLACVAAAGCDTSYLDTNDVLEASFDPAVLYVSTSVESDCFGGALVSLAAHHADGTAADGAVIQLWLTGSTTAALSKDSVTLNSNGTDRTACLSPGLQVGTTTLHARSGPVETMQTIDVRPLAVPTGGMLALSLTPVPVTTPAASTCGMVAAGCGPTGRTGAIAIQATSTDLNPVPDGAVVGLATNLGLLSSRACSVGAGATSNLLAVTLTGGQASAFACFDDSGGSATITAHSGSVSQSAQLVLHPALHGIVLAADRAAAAANDTVTFAGSAVDCTGQGIAAIPVVLQVDAGAFDLATGTTSQAKTGMDGTVTFTGTVRAVPLKVSISVLSAPQVACQTTVAAAGAP